jgi:hypothetical protein
MPPVNDEDGRLDWHDHPGVIWAAGVAALALVGLLVYAVIRVSGGSSLLPGDAPPAPSYATTSSTSTGTSTTEDQSGPTETTTSTTIYNPYSSTTPTNAGHI